MTKVAEELAKLIDADGSYAASASGSAITITEGAGIATITVNANGALLVPPLSGIQLTKTNASISAEGDALTDARSITLSGKVVVGTYTLKIKATTPPANEAYFIYTATATSTLSEVAANLAARINEHDNYTASVGTGDQATTITISTGAGTAVISLLANEAIIKADKLVHLVAPKIQVSGIIETGFDGIAYGASNDGRILINAGTELKVSGGYLTSNGTIELNAGVNMAWQRPQLEATITRTQLSGGTISVAGQGLLNAAGAVAIQAGGDVTLDADPGVASGKEVQIPVYTTVAKTVDVVTDYRQVEDGTMLVPEITWERTEITEAGIPELVEIGKEFTTMTVVLTQLGYYNAVTKQFKETFIEGLDYSNNNSDIWTAGALVPDTVTVWKGLDDTQKLAVLNYLGYKPIYQFNYFDAKRVITRNDRDPYTVATTPAWDKRPDASKSVDWSEAKIEGDTTVQGIYLISVAGWNDKYIRMPVGAENDIQQVVSTGTTKYLTGDTTLDGYSNSTNSTTTQWLPNPGDITGEFVGQYQDMGYRFRIQDKTEMLDSSRQIFPWREEYNDFDNSGKHWDELKFQTGTRSYSIKNGFSVSPDVRSIPQNLDWILLTNSTQILDIPVTVLAGNYHEEWWLFGWQSYNWKDVYEVDHHYIDEVKSNWQNIYDQRKQVTYTLYSLPKAIYDYETPYITSIKDVMVVNMKEVTNWKTEPIISKQTVLTTEMTMKVAPGRSYSDFSADSISGSTVSINSGGSVRLSGKVSASTTLQIDAAALLQVKGNVVSGKTVASSLSGATVTLNAGTTLYIDDSAEVIGTAATDKSVGFVSGNDMTLGGKTTATSALSVIAKRNITISGELTGASVTIAAGAGDSKAGTITADAETKITATTSTLVLSSGEWGGNILLTQATLSATSGNVSLTANSGRIEQVEVEQSINGVTQFLPSGLIKAASLTATANNGLKLNTQVASVTLSLSGAGNIALYNVGDNLELQDVTAYDGAITITTYGNFLATLVQAKGSSDRNDISLTTYDVDGKGSGTANLTIKKMVTGVRGDLLLNIQGQIILPDNDADVIVAESLAVTVAGGLKINTDVKRISITTTHTGDVTVTQGSTNVVFDKVEITDGSFTVTAAGGSVDLADVRLTSNNEDNDISVTADGDILVRFVSAGVYFKSR
ncbi:MAG: hypothetical protein JZU70_06475 [Chlorobium sp.]|nr:hypothetical protein [Chlorobium sp.]